MLKRVLISAILIGFLFLGDNAGATLIGHDIIDRSSLDGWSGFTMIDTSLRMTDQGVIDSWSIFARRTGDIYLQVFRNIGGNSYQVIGENSFSLLGTGALTLEVAPEFKIAYDVGDYIGWTLGGLSIIPHDKTGDSVRWPSSSGLNATGIGSTITLSGAGNRTYSIAAETTPVPEPSTMVLLGSGFLGLFLFHNRKKSRN